MDYYRYFDSGFVVVAVGKVVVVDMEDFHKEAAVLPDKAVVAAHKAHNDTHYVYLIK